MVKILILAEVAESADAHGLGPCGATRGGSTPLFGTCIFSPKNGKLSFNDYF